MKHIIFGLIMCVTFAFGQSQEMAMIGDEQDPPEDIKVDKMPSPISTVAVKYPEVLRKAGIEGMVWLKLIVNEEGIPNKVTVLKSETNAKENNSEPFEQAAMQSVAQWKFSPAVLNGKPVKVWVTVPIKFKLQKDEKKP